MIRPHETESPEASETISGYADEWMRAFVRHFEVHFVDACRDLPPNAGEPSLQRAAVLAILATLSDSGMEPSSALDLLSQAAIDRSSTGAIWDDASNQRRFALIDKEIQGTLTPAESIELAGLTRVMRDHVESEANLPMQAAQELHRKLLELDSTGASD